jgi:hypothetical protein
LAQMMSDEAELAVVPLRDTKSSPVDLKTRAMTSKPSLLVMLSITFPEKSVIEMVFKSGEYAISSWTKSIAMELLAATANSELWIVWVFDELG